MSKSPPLTGEPLVVCDLCGTVVNQSSATKKTAVTPQGPRTIMVCSTCMHLGSEEQTKKYIMKEEKEAGR
jgi:ribosome-binding protein aMBF1 (putative translation factor)